MTRNSTGPRCDSNFKPSCSCTAVKNEGLSSVAGLIRSAPAGASGVHRSVRSKTPASPVLSTTVRPVIVEMRLAKTVIVVTHDVGEAAHLADVVVLMRAGRVVQQGPFETLASSPADPFVTAFLATGNAPSPPRPPETRG